MFKTPWTTCELQKKIILNKFIKQEYIEESTETIDYGDHESHSTTYQVYGKDTREIDVIDGAIYESFIKREINEQIDDEPLYTSTTSENCYIECKPTIYDGVMLVGKSQMNDSHKVELSSEPTFNEPDVPGKSLSTYLDRISSSLNRTPSRQNSTPSVLSSSLHSKSRRHSSNNMSSTEINDGPKVEMSSEPKLNELNVLGRPLSTSLDKTPASKNKTPSEPLSSHRTKSHRLSPNKMSSTEMHDDAKVEMASEPKLKKPNVPGQPLNTSLNRTPSNRKRTPSSKNKTPCNEPSSSLRTKSCRLSPNKMSSTEMHDDAKVEIASEPKLKKPNVPGQPLSTPLDKTPSSRKRSPSEPSSSIRSKSRRRSSNNISSTETNDGPKVEMSSEPKLNELNVLGRPLSTSLDRTPASKNKTPSEPSSSHRTKSRRLSPNKMSSTEMHDDAKVEMASEPKLKKPNVLGRPLNTSLDRTSSSQNKTPSVTSSLLRSKSRRHSPTKMSSAEINYGPKVETSSNPKINKPNVLGRPLSTSLDRIPSVPSSSLRCKLLHQTPNNMSLTEMKDSSKVKMPLEPKLSEPSVQCQPLNTPLDRTPSSRKRTPNEPSSLIHSKSRRRSSNNISSTEINDGPKVETSSSEPNINKHNIPGQPLNTSLVRTSSSRKITTSNRNTSPSSRHRSPLSQNRMPSVPSSSLHYTSRRHSLTNMFSTEINHSRKVQMSSEPILNEYVTALVKEKYALNASTHPYTMKLIDKEIARSININGVPESTYLDIHNDNPIRLTAKVRVPVNDFPRINLIPKLLGPKGSLLQQIQKDTKTKMAILGKGSMRDKKKEDELRNSLNPKFAHFSDELHVQVIAFATPVEAYARVTCALVELKKVYTPALKHQIEQEQAHEIELCGGALPPKPDVQLMHPVNALSKSLDKSYGDSGSYRKSHFDSGYGDVETYNKDGDYYKGNSYSKDNCYRGSIFNQNWKSKMAKSIPYGDVETYNGSGNDDDYYSGNSYSQDNNQSGGRCDWKKYNPRGSGGPSKLTGNQGSVYGGRNAPYTR